MKKFLTYLLVTILMVAALVGACYAGALDGNWKVVFYHTTLVQGYFLTFPFTTRVMDSSPFLDLSLPVKDGKVGDIDLLNNSYYKIEFELPPNGNDVVIFRGVMQTGDVVLGTRQATPGDPTWK